MKKKRDITIKLSNKLFYTLIVIGILAVVGVGVWALGSVPNPGHAISELQTCEEGETLQVVDGEWDCVSGVSIRGWEKIQVVGGPNQFYISASCSSGKKLLGGGCLGPKVWFSYPYDDDTWICDFDEPYGETYVICAYAE